MAHPAPIAQKPSTEWIPKAEAAALLQLSTRELERKARQGLVRTQLINFPGEKNARAVYSVADLERLKSDRAIDVRTPGMALTAPQASAAATAQVEAWGSLAKTLAGLSAFVADNNRKYSPRAWLTFEEAVEHSGLPPAKLAELLRAEQVYAFGRGPKSWRVQRASLDGFGNAPRQ